MRDDGLPGRGVALEVLLVQRARRATEAPHLRRAQAGSEVGRGEEAESPKEWPMPFVEHRKLHTASLRVFGERAASGEGDWVAHARNDAAGGGDRGEQGDRVRHRGAAAADGEPPDRGLPRPGAGRGDGQAAWRWVRLRRARPLVRGEHRRVRLADRRQVRRDRRPREQRGDRLQVRGPDAVRRADDADSRNEFLGHGPSHRSADAAPRGRRKGARRGTPRQRREHERQALPARARAAATVRRRRPDARPAERPRRRVPDPSRRRPPSRRGLRQLELRHVQARPHRLHKAQGQGRAAGPPRQLPLPGILRHRHELPPRPAHAGGGRAERPHPRDRGLPLQRGVHLRLCAGDVVSEEERRGPMTYSGD
mmetsp:Transcript_16437/g.51478  ORF Transcript_16437/g.51478 Transcript_16437/m.51478 type:complete len:367 (-) Transcript_16437:368-1468(-)